MSILSGVRSGVGRTFKVLFPGVRWTLRLWKGEVQKSKAAVGALVDAAKSARDSAAPNYDAPQDIGFEAALAARKPGALDVPGLRAYFLGRKRAALLCGALALLSGAWGVGSSVQSGHVAGLVLSAASLPIGLAIAFLHAFSAQHRIWQLEVRRLSVTERGGLNDFRREVPGWIWHVLSPEVHPSRALLRWIVCAIAFVILALAAASAFAQSVSLGEISQASKRSTDKSREALVTVYGQVVNNPLASGSSGGKDTIIASVFQLINGGLLVVAGLFIFYLIYKRVTRLANNAEVFDRQQNAMGPIRLFAGFIALVPTANGWSLAQLIFLWCASVMGVGLANLATDVSVDMLSEGTGLVVKPVMPSTVGLAQNVYAANLCMHGVNAGIAQELASGGLVTATAYVQQQPTKTGFVLKNATFICGGADVNADLAEQNNSNGWFSGTVDTSDLRKAHLKALQEMQQQLTKDAQGFVNALVERRGGSKKVLPDAQIAIQSAAQRYEAIISAAAGPKQGNVDALMKNVSNSIKTAGWWSLGAWYQTFAQATSKVSDAVAARATAFGMSSDGDPAVLAVYETAMAAYQAQRSISDNAGAMGQVKAADFSKGASGSDASKVIGSVFDAPGQRITNYITGWNLGAENRGQVNPLIKMKNLGDYLLGAGEAAVITYAGIKTILKVKSGWSVTGIAMKAVNLLTSVGDALEGVMDAVSPFIILGIIALFGFGVTLSIYIPMVPFVVWFGGVINWLVIVGLAVIASPLWAFSILASDGDGMGQRASHGFIWMLDVTLRPLLMVAGFLIGGACIIVGGTFLNWIYGIALANAQFDSITGLVSVLGFVALYCSIALNMIHACSNLSLVVPDQAIAWAGGAAVVTPGRDMNDQVKGAMNIFGSKIERNMERPRGPRGGDRKGPSKGDGVSA